MDGSYTGKDIAIDVVFLNRDHGYSTTKLKENIWHSMEIHLEKMEGLL